MGSAAVVEGHWRSSKRVLTEERNSMDPLIFEAIMYLKMNKRLWGKAEVVEANKRRKKAAKQNNRNLHIKLQEKLRAVQEWAGTEGQTDELWLSNYLKYIQNLSGLIQIYSRYILTQQVQDISRIYPG